MRAARFVAVMRDHDRQLLRQLNELGVDTESQDYVFYAYETALP